MATWLLFLNLDDCIPPTEAFSWEAASYEKSMVFKGSKPSSVAFGKLLNLSVSQFPSSSKVKYANIWGALSSGPGHNKHQSPPESAKLPASAVSCSSTTFL